jgi:hypothetical protein
MLLQNVAARDAYFERAKAAYDAVKNTIEQSEEKRKNELVEQLWFRLPLLLMNFSAQNADGILNMWF